MIDHYSKEYFDWQAPIGKFGGWANQTKFREYIAPSDRVLDFGCGGGFLLSRLNCGERIGVEINPTAIAVAKENGLTVYSNTTQLPKADFDVIISNNALEHTEHPLQELQSLLPKLRVGGKIVFVVPCESID